MHKVFKNKAQRCSTPLMILILRILIFSITLLHLCNFKCCIDTWLWSFYFKVFHKAITFNDFLFKINRKDSSNCGFCKTFPESIIHVFIANVNMLILFGKKCWGFKISMILIFWSQILIKFLVFRKKTSYLVVLHCPSLICENWKKLWSLLLGWLLM